MSDRNTCYWIGEVSNRWDNPANWRDGVLPKSGDIVVDTTGNEIDLRGHAGVPMFHRIEFMTGKANVLCDPVTLPGWFGDIPCNVDSS